MNKILEASRGKKSDMHENATRSIAPEAEIVKVESEPVKSGLVETAEQVVVEEESYLIQKSHPRGRDRWAKGLSNQEAIFVKTYCEGAPKAEASRTAGFLQDNLTTVGTRLLKKRHIRDAVVAFRAFSLKALNLEVDDITRAFAAIAFADMADYYDSDGNVLAPKDMPNTAAVQEITMTTKPSGEVTYKLKLESKSDALKELAKAVGYYLGHEKAKRPLNINLNGLSLDELRKLAKMNGEETVNLEE